MKTRSEAVNALLAAGWTLADIESVLGRPSGPNGSKNDASKSPWWTWVTEEWYTGGTPLVREWEAWVERSNA